MRAGGLCGETGDGAGAIKLLPEELLARFAPHQALAAQLLPYQSEGGDGAHDVSHILRVWTNVRAIQREDGGDLEILLAACLLHDVKAVEKNHPDRSLASRLSADIASRILTDLHWSVDRVARVAHAVEAHSFSAAIAPQTLEAEILQDADRLDAIGAIGIARCFYTAGRLGAALYDVDDPHANDRPLNDTCFALDHFETKLLRLSSGFRTQAGRRFAAIRHERMALFLADLDGELDWETV